MGRTFTREPEFLEGVKSRTLSVIEKLKPKPKYKVFHTKPLKTPEEQNLEEVQNYFHKEP